jgi:ribonuclease Z
VKLHFLGTTGYHPNNQRQTACLMLPEAGIIFDAGTGLFRARDLIETSELDIFLSHVHLDHCIGLTFLYDVLWDKNVSRVTVHVAENKIPSIKSALFHQDLFPVEPNFELRPLMREVELSAGIQLKSFPLQHPGGCHGFRLIGPELSMAYVTDTYADPDADYLEHIRGVKHLIHECYFCDGSEEWARKTGHSCLTPVAQVAARCQAESLHLIHINPLDETSTPLDLESVRSIFPSIVVPTDQQVIDV